MVQYILFITTYHCSFHVLLISITLTDVVLRRKYQLLDRGVGISTLFPVFVCLINIVFVSWIVCWL